MPDHVRAAKADPPNFADRSWANTWSLAMTFLAFLVGVVIICDVLTPVEWYASHSLENIAVPIQLIIGAILILGAISTSIGVLVRPKKWKPSASIILERTGWQVIGFAWAGFTVAMLTNARSGSTLVIIITSFLVLGCYAKSLYLRGVLQDLKMKVVTQRMRTGEHSQVQGV